MKDRNEEMKTYNIIKTREGLWKLEEVGLDEKNEPYLKHIKLSGNIEALKILKRELEQNG